MANGRFQVLWLIGKYLVWWPMQGSKFHGQWGNISFGSQCKVPSFMVNGETFHLVANGRFQAWWPLGWKGKTSFSFPSIFHPIRFYLNFFSIDFCILLYHGSRPLFCFLPSFSLTYKLQSRISKYQIFHTFITKSILNKSFFPFFEFMALCMTMCYKSQTTQMNEDPPHKLSIVMTFLVRECYGSPKKQEF